MENGGAGPDSRVGGKVKFFSNAKGWGMISRFPNDDGGGDYFVHHQSIMMEGYRELWDGELVTFIPCVGSKGRYADQVVPTARALVSFKERLTEG